MTESDAIEALRRAGKRVVYHLLRAGVEGLRALEAIADELGRMGDKLDEEEGPQKVTIE